MNAKQRRKAYRAWARARGGVSVRYLPDLTQPVRLSGRYIEAAGGQGPTMDEALSALSRIVWRREYPVTLISAEAIEASRR